MRVLHISKYDLKGGASRAACRSVASQRAASLQAELFVGIKSGKNDFVRSTSKLGHFLTLVRFAADKTPTLLFGRTPVRSLHFFGRSAKAIQRRFRPDLVILHNVDGVVALRSFTRFTVPIIWRTHDMWPICGMRHYQPENQVLGSGAPRWTGGLLERTMDSYLFEYKRKIYKKARALVFCPPSNWLAECLQSSPVFDSPPPMRVVPNGIDTSTFRPIDTARSRTNLNLPVDTRVILFGATYGTTDKRKGFDLLVEAVRLLVRKGAEDFHLLIFGDYLPADISSLSIATKSVGVIADNNLLANIYSAADVFVCPSRQENLSLTVLESLSCGTPVLAFDIGGMRDMIFHERNGWLATPFSVDCLADNLHKAITIPDKLRRSYREAARATITTRFSLDVEAKGMQDLYRDVLHNQIGLLSSQET